MNRKGFHPVENMQMWSQRFCQDGGGKGSENIPKNLSSLCSRAERENAHKRGQEQLWDQAEGAEHQQSSLHLQNQGSSDDLSLCATPVPLLGF